MTEFETATLALQQGQLWAAIAIPAVSGLVGLGQCALIWIGLRRMDQANRARLAEAEARERREDAREKREDARHAEAMRGMETRHAEAMARLDQQADTLRAVVQSLERQGAALERQGAALEAALTGRA